jgi:putative restriction endonuclease
VPVIDPDHSARLAAIDRVRELDRFYDGLIPLPALREGFEFQGRRISLGSFFSGIHRPKEFLGPAALSLITAPRVEGRRPVYDDELDAEGGSALYHYRAGSLDHPDNRALIAAFEQQVPVIYFHGLAPGQYVAAAPVFVSSNDRAGRCVLLEFGLPVADLAPGGPVSSPDVRRYALREFKTRLHQQHFRGEVLRAYRHRCTVCALRERSLLQAAHIIDDSQPGGVAAVINGLALCAIHHLAYDRNVLGIDPRGVVHIAARLLREHDGPMLREGLQGFHGRGIELPRRVADRPDPERLERRFEEFSAVA